MAVTRITGAWADTTEQTIYSGACKVTSIIIRANDSQSAKAFLQLWDAADPTPGTTVPYIQVAINTQALSGKKLFKFIFPGGIDFATACTAFVSTAGAGGTAPLTTVLPQYVEVYFTVGSN